MSSKDSGSYIPPNQFASDTIITNDNSLLQQKLNDLQNQLKSNEDNITCPFCKKEGITKVDKSCSFPTGVFCIFGGVFIPLLIQLCRKKDLNCTNADHYCACCGNKLVSYKSC